MGLSGDELEVFFIPQYKHFFWWLEQKRKDGGVNCYRTKKEALEYIQYHTANNIEVKVDRQYPDGVISKYQLPYCHIDMDDEPIEFNKQ